MKNILFVSDLDGTLLNNQKQLSQTTVEILNPLLSQGLKFTVSTARTPATLQNILAPLNLNLPLCCMNGAAIYSLSKKAYIHYTALNPQDVITVAEICKSCNVYPFVHVIKNNFMYVYYQNINNRPAQAFHNERKNLILKKYVNSSYTPACGTPVYLTILGAEANVKQILTKCQFLKKRLFFNFYEDIYNKGYYYLEICHQTATKRTGVEYIKNLSNADLVYAFGDNSNDLPMLNFADKSFAVENAAKNVKAACNHIIGKNTQNSVALTIQSVFSSK